MVLDGFWGFSSRSSTGSILLVGLLGRFKLRWVRHSHVNSIRSLTISRLDFDIFWLLISWICVQLITLVDLHRSSVSCFKHTLFIFVQSVQSEKPVSNLTSFCAWIFVELSNPVWLMLLLEDLDHIIDVHWSICPSFLFTSPLTFSFLS